MFSLYLKEGFKHITDLHAYDHMAFLMALTAGFTFKDIKRLLILITAFTIGHSLTLLLAALDKILIPSTTIEFLIPVTILITAVFQLFRKEKMDASFHRINYFITFLFGLIHGSGFSNHFKALMGRASNITQPLLGFNIGVEIGQIVIVTILLLLASLLIDIIGLSAKLWKSILAIFAVLISIYLITQTWPF